MNQLITRGHHPAASGGLNEEAAVQHAVGAMKHGVGSRINHLG